MSSPIVEFTGQDGQDEILEPAAQQPRPLSRRSILAGGMSAALAAVAGSALGQEKPMQDIIRTGPGNNLWGMSGSGANMSLVNPVVTVRSWQDVDLRLLRRTCYGVTQSDIDEIKSRGYENYINWQLDAENIDDSECENRVTNNCPMLQWSYKQLAAHNFQWDCTRTWMDAVWWRSIFSKRQLKHRLVEFWSDHFYVDGSKFNGSLLLDYYRKAIYPHAMGTFLDLLMAIGTHGGMMYYLDNRESTAGKTNVNYSRELMELYTLGTSGGYTGDDIFNLADIFTGWGCMEPPCDEPFGFKYSENLHDPTPKKVLGQVFDQPGMQQGIAFMEFLAAHPKTMEFIGNKMCRFFLGRNASPAHMDRIKQAWGTKGDIKAVVRVILDKKEVAASNAKFKRPNYLILGAIRESGMLPNGMEGVIWELRNASMEPFSWRQPNGWPDTFDYWSGGMARRVRFALLLASEKVWNLQWFDIAKLKGLSDEQKVERINRMFFQGELPSSDAIWIRRYLKGKTTNEQIRGAVGLALAAPSYQWF